jgi:hypothetical protein
MSEPTLPSDTEMLDWMIDRRASVCCFVSKYWVNYQGCNSDDYSDPRAAIAAEMAKEAK